MVLATSSPPSTSLLWRLILGRLRLSRRYQPFYGFHPDDSVLKVNRGDFIRIRNQCFRPTLGADNQHVIHTGLNDVFDGSKRFVVRFRDDGQANQLKSVVGAAR